MYLEYFILGFLIFSIGFAVGWFNHALDLFKRIRNDPDEMLNLLISLKQAKGEQLDLAVQQVDSRNINVEKHDTQFYLYAQDNGEFLAQGNSLTAALDQISKRFPGQQFNGIVPKEKADAWSLSKEFEQTK